ncbi:MAG: hypothetical protein DMF90_11095, partial [Acidobacteria bacterium]
MADHRYPIVGAPSSENAEALQTVAQGYAGAADEDDRGNLQDYLRILYRRRWPTVIVFAAVLTLMMLFSYRQVSLYEGRAQLLIEVEQPKVLNFQPATEQQNFLDFYPTQYKVLQSRSLARRTIDALDLWNNSVLVGPRQAAPSLSPMRYAKGLVSRILPSRPATTEGAAVGQTAAPSGEDAVMETPQQAAVIDAFLGRLTISPVKESRLVDLRFRSTDPVLSATVPNGLAKAYIEQTMEFKFDTSREASNWLGQRLTEQRKKVEASELALQQYREQSGSVALDDRQNIVVQKLADLNAAVTKAKTERLAKEASYQQLEKAQNDPQALDTLPVVLGNVFVQQLRSELATLQRQEAQMAEKLGEKHVDMIKIRSAIQSMEAKLQTEVGKVVQSMRNDYQASVAQEQSLVAALEAQKRDALGLNRKGIEYGVLQREAESNRQLYNNVLQRAKETGVSESLRASTVRIVDYAQVPRSPIFPDRYQDSVIALCTALVCALGTALLFEYLDSRIKTPDEIKSRLGLPYLGLLPSLPKKSAERTALLISNNVPATFAEAFRHVRTSVLFSLAEDGAKSLLMTSTGPGEGKTMVSANLAVALAQAGNRVLLIDADMRRPKLHFAFEECQE